MLPRKVAQNTNKMDKELKITDRQVAHLREEISRVQRQFDLIKKGITHVSGKDRMDIASDCCKEIDSVLCGLK